VKVAVKASGKTALKIVVIDDDPTGSQTVHGCPLLLRWDPTTLAAGLRHPSPLLFVLANSRALEPRAAAERVRGLCRALRQALEEVRREGVIDRWLVVSRGDSTLRGHCPLEAEVIAAGGPRCVDVALDALGGKATASCRGLLAPLGRLVFYGLSDAMPGWRQNWLEMARAWLRTPRFHPLSLIEPNIGVFGVHLLHLQSREEILRDRLERIYALVTAGRVRPILNRTFPLDRAGAVAAHEYLHGRQVIGKVVLTV